MLEINSSDSSIAILLLTILFVFIGIVAKWRLFVKCNQPGVACFVPIWDIIVTLKIVGRPPSHIWLFLIPVFNLFFAFKILIELAQSFGKTSIVDYVMVVALNILYVLNLSLAYNETYHGPVYGMSNHQIKERDTQYARA